MVLQVFYVLAKDISFYSRLFLEFLSLRLKYKSKFLYSVLS